ncbi:hypothetical protein V2T44_01415 [Serratia ficaria]|uniref:STM2901 family protein n=1 Tax=Serratia ficaria TaxID=61651 RepID=UPI002ED30F0D|nr:hypothetical protein [Serratia ficaria]
MDTVEELGGTYFYGGLPNLSAGELYFWVIVDVTAEHFTGIGAVSRDLFAAASIYLGRNTIQVPGKLAGARPGTSLASKLARKHLKGIYMPFRLPTIVGSPPDIDIIMTKKLSAFVGRAVPVVGWVIAASDVTYITWKATARYNTIARGNDKIW